METSSVCKSFTGEVVFVTPKRHICTDTLQDIVLEDHVVVNIQENENGGIGTWYS